MRRSKKGKPGKECKKNITVSAEEWYDGLRQKQGSEEYIMNCINCYQEIPDGTNFCPYCGAKQSGYPEPVCTGAEEQPGEQTIAASSQTEGQNDQTPDSSASETAGGQQTQEETSDPRQTQETSEPWRSRQYNQQSYAAGPGRAADPSGMPGQEGRPYQAPPVYQQPYQPGVQEETVNWVPYLILSIISTLCCCLPLGIAGIVYSAKINSMITEGRPGEAKQAAKTATIWIIAAFAVGLILDVCAFLLVLTAAVTDSYYGGIFDVIRHLAH